jgi:hypothetical protein
MVSFYGRGEREEIGFSPYFFSTTGWVEGSDYGI